MPWVDVAGYEPFYEVNNEGLIRSKRTGKIRKPIANPKNGYLMMFLCGVGKKKCVYVHRIVAKAFCSNPNGYTFVNHKDENKQNNSSTNLEWCTKQYNNVYGSKLERYYKPIVQIDPKTGEETEWKSCVFPEKAGIANRKNISACCRGLRKTTGGYQWKYKENENGCKA